MSLPLLRGPVNAIHIPSIPYDIYIFGEDHDREGQCEPHHSYTDIEDFVIAKKNARIFLETTWKDIQMQKMYSRQPLPPIDRVAQKIISEKILMDVVFGNIRRIGIYAPFEILYDPKTFLFHNYIIRNIATIHLSYFVNIEHTKLRSFEKTLLSHISSRKKCKDFLFDLLLPDRVTPEWYIEEIEKLELSDITQNPVKDELRNLAMQHPMIYDKIQIYMTQYWDAMLNEKFSPVVAKMERIQRSKIIAYENRKVKLWTLFLKALYSIIQDVFMICDMVKHCTKKPYIAIIGSAHVQNMAILLQSIFGTGRIYISTEGCIDLEKPVIHLSIHPSEYRKDFTDFLQINTSELGKKN